MQRTLVLAVLLAASVQADLGDRLVRTFTKYVPFPTTTAEAVAGDWAAVGGCVEGLGMPYMLPSSKANATTLYFTMDGKVSGISVDVFGKAPPVTLIAQGYFVKLADKKHRISLGYRNAATVCTNTTFAEAIGDRVVINPATLNQSIPLTVDAAQAGNWHKGSCFYGMGHHYFYDLATAPEMSWTAENLLPIVPMYNNAGLLQATFFASWTVQESILHGVDWEPVPLPNALMCMNTCDHECTFKGTELWSTYHVYYRDLDAATCTNDCKLHCCP